MGRIHFKNAVILDPEGDQPTLGGLLVDGDRIAEQIDTEQPAPEGFAVIDLAGAQLAPGFVDLHYHGGLATDDADRFSASLDASSASLTRSGTTAFLATTVATPRAQFAHSLTQLASSIATGRWRGAVPIGIHLEGPWINPAAAGAQPQAGIRSCRSDEVAEVLSIAGELIEMVTLAPEVEGVARLQAALEAAGIRTALGHSHATGDQVRDAIERGATHVTHLFNAMGPIHQRAPGLAGTALSDDRLTCDLICDGVHVDAAMVRLAARAKRERLLLISDRIEIGMTQDDAPRDDANLTHASIGGIHLFDDGRALRLEDGRLAGSRLRLDDAIRNVQQFAGVSLLEAVAAASLRPARAIGIENTRGTLRRGARADLVVLEASGAVRETWVGGRRVHP